MLRVIKVRLYPNSQQQQALSQAFGNCRWLWNYCLNLMNQTYQDTGKGLSGYEVKKQIPQLKKEIEDARNLLLRLFLGRKPAPYPRLMGVW